MPAVPGGKPCGGQVLRGLRSVAREPMPCLRRGTHPREEVLWLVWCAGILAYAPDTIPAGVPAARAERMDDIT